jgi:hypothetical protein
MLRGGEDVMRGGEDVMRGGEDVRMGCPMSLKSVELSEYFNHYTACPTTRCLCNDYVTNM